VTSTADRKAAALAFATRLNELLAELRISRRELARRLTESSGGSFETARTSVHRLLRAEHVPNESTRHQVADALGVERSEFEEAALSGDPFPGHGQTAPPDSECGS
jgi:transcriptional regulator with XRE-family HTH domain